MGQYPNPDNVRYATTLPPPFPCQMTTRTASKSYPIHYHGAWINAAGDGNTDVDAGHFHRVRNGRVLADQTDGHTHDLTMLPCGAGGAHPMSRNQGPLMLGAGPQVITDPNFDPCAGITDQTQKDACRLHQIQLENQRMQAQSASAQHQMQKNLLLGLGAVLAVGAVVGAVVLLRR